MGITHHDPSKVLLGTTQLSGKEVSSEVGNPVTFPAGVAVRRSSDGGLSLSAGSLIGISLGRDLADTNKTAICRTGEMVPLQLTDVGSPAGAIIGDLIFVAKDRSEAAEEITIELVDSASAGAEAVVVNGKSIVVAIEDGVSTAQQIATAINANAEAVALVTVTVDDGQGSQAQDAAAEEALSGWEEPYPYVLKGKAVLLNATTGKADETGSATGAVYVDGPLTGIDPVANTQSDVAIVDMPGGL